MIINGIDVLDPTRLFTAQEWEALGYNGGQAYVMQARECMNSQGGRGHDTGGHNQCNASLTNMEPKGNAEGGSTPDTTNPTTTRARVTMEDNMEEGLDAVVTRADCLGRLQQ